MCIRDRDRGGHRPQPLDRDQVPGPQLTLRERRHGTDQGERRRVEGGRRAADVDDAHQPAVPWIAHRGRRTGPSVQGPDEVLRRMDLDGDPGGERRPDRVRPGRRLRPGGPLLQADVLGQAQHRRVALAPQHPALRVGDHEDLLGRVRDGGQPVPQQRHHLAERRAAAPVLDLVRLQQLALRRLLGIDAAAQHPLPGRVDLGAWRRHRAVARQPGLPGPVHQTGRVRGGGPDDGTCFHDRFPQDDAWPAPRK